VGERSCVEHHRLVRVGGGVDPPQQLGLAVRFGAQRLFNPNSAASRFDEARPDRHGVVLP